MYSLLIISIMAASLNNTLLHKLPDSTNIYRFNLHISILWICILFVMNHGKITLNKGIILWGVIYGVAQVLFLIFKTLAMLNGPVSITTLIGNCSMFLSISASIIIWNEKIHIGHVLGLLLLLFSIFLCINSNDTMTYKKHWILYSILYFLLCGCIGIIFKLFATSEYNQYRLDMMLVSAFIISISLCIILVKGHSNSVFHYSSSYFLLVFLCGIMSCSYTLLNLYLSGNLPGTVFFPAFNGGVIVLTAILGRFILHEKLTIKQIIGIICGTISVSILSIL